MFAKIYNWFVVSSADPYKFSLALKAGAATIVSVLTVLLGFAHVSLGASDLTPVADAFIAFIQAAVIFVGSLLTLIGVVRKVWRSLAGTHAGLNAVPGTGLTIAS